MPKYEDVIDLYDDYGKRIAKDVPLEAISPLRNKAIQKIASLTKRTIAVNLAGIEKALATGQIGGSKIAGKEIEVPLVKDAKKLADDIKAMVQVTEGDDTVVEVKNDGKLIVVIVPEDRLNAGVEYTTGFTAVAAAITEAIIDRYKVPMYKANMVKGAVWGQYPQTVNFAGSNIKTILEVPQMNEGAGFALRNIMSNHVVALVQRNAMQGAALSSLFETCAAYEMGDAIGPFERQHLLSLAYQGLNANNLVYSLVKKNGKTGTVGTVVESLMERAIDDGVIRVKETLPSGYNVYTTDDLPKWNAYAAAGEVAAVMVNVGAARAAQGVPSTVLYYNDLLEHESALPGVDYGRAEGVGVGMSFFSHSIYGGGGPGLFHGNHVVTRHAKGTLIPAVTAGNCLDGGTQTFSAEATSGLFKDVFGGMPEFNTPMQFVGAEAKKIKNKL
ncbi:Methyl coenzyme M reductase beta subunit [Candidatus Methanomethylophilus alvi Mx1201]|jgi:methyl-coenzyme M reductase beta subunit|uniref:Methyl-coenzyme M reductase subunit beta n=2 Tax=Methanomethylophilus alvi TaxID=1291540 RepID=M9S9U8_METAX|nr:coenzyme-B sulfoethylthiotransferase subunit beta [Methanomethylophilus alvi]CDF30180.1 methyl-coenzyme M reductase beta subunit [Methanoculleus sp. CAG:1088]AGI85141.1 Methyl coenzyme M reductase beta subunit [Candidatus Methanomethylophilus alvi Mx1201]AYQ54572.1 coenzyme-B sulfoethylthiotransferase subunit beta [Methanomethylophilus alvi]MCI5973848.1 coenzyme-B sulfoethylthiotransferase subunit beta [Methanomethylophilus alvi]MDD7480434.1 coenzyme-B sulfoethylthiotransferase subunit beta